MVHPPLDTQVLAGRVQGREAAALAAGSSRAGDAGRQGYKLARRLRRLGGQTGVMLASLVPCLAGMRGSSDG